MLFVVLGVHEHEVGAIAVEVGGVAPVDRGGVHLHPGVERLVDDLAGQHVLQLGPHEGRTLAGFVVLELGDGPQLAVDLQDEPILEVGGRCHGRYYSSSIASSLGNWVSRSGVFSQTTRVSSMRTPPRSGK